MLKEKLNSQDNLADDFDKGFDQDEEVEDGEPEQQQD